MRLALFKKVRDYTSTLVAYVGLKQKSVLQVKSGRFEQIHNQNH